MNEFDKMRERDEYVSLSLLHDFYYCKRRCCLILLEGHTGENLLMAEGNIGHELIHQSKIEKRIGFAKLYNLQLSSQEYNLIGKADCVECVESPHGSFVDILEGKYILTPIEYKHGKERNADDYNIQLCAQAMCLEEMYKTHIDYGYIHYIDDDTRVEVKLDDVLRQKVVFGVLEIFKIIENNLMAEPKLKKSCNKCALYEKCNPKHNSIKRYMEEMWGELD